jgi:hypothetical protein
VSLRTLSVAQWAGLVVGAGAWVVQFAAGWGVAQGGCSDVALVRPVHNDVWQGLLLAVAVAAVVGAEAAAVVVLRRTRGVSYEDAAPMGRIRFFAIAAAVVNVIFFGAIVLNGIGGIATSCTRGGA